MMGLVGIVVLLLVAYAASTNRSKINWRTVGGAFALQLSLAAFVLYIPFGQSVLASVSSFVLTVISYADAGIAFLFGPLADKSQYFIFAVHVLTVIIFFSSLIAVLYHIGVMSLIIKVIGGGLQKLLGTSKPESMCAAANLFVGQTESPLVIRPFIPTMTRSELFAVMVCGLATIAGSVMAGYVGLGIDPRYLIAACFMGAPGALLMAKMLVPETGQPINELSDVVKNEEKHSNVIDAAAAGAASGMQLALNVGAMLLAFVGLIALLNGIVGSIGGWFGVEGVTIQLLLGYLFQPLAFILGVSWEEARLAGSFIGQKLVINEFVAYLDFVQAKEALSAHTQVIVTFALCGFANFSSIAILLGGLGGMAPSRRADIAQLGLKALFAATLANLMSAAIAGFFISLG